MYREDKKQWIKHLDFIFLDVLILQIAYCLAFFFRHGSWNVYGRELYLTMGVSLTLCDLLVIFLVESYHGVLRRDPVSEFINTLEQALEFMILGLVYLFAAQVSEQFSRLTYFFTGVIYVVLSYAARLGWKAYLRRHRKDGSRALLVITTSAKAPQVLESLQRNNYGVFRIAGVILTDSDSAGSEVCGFSVVANMDTALDWIRKAWVDEVFVSAPQRCLPEALTSVIAEMGVTIHFDLDAMVNIPGRMQIVEKFSSYSVVTSTMNCLGTKQAMIKRTMDILGGFVGCVITGLLFLFVAPAIYIASPGPIFFKQERIGKNGKHFFMYKFRSMYPDAEQRLQELKAENSLDTDLMFKMDFDPRIIGNKILPDGTKKTGIGQFLRNTSIDEFPQFINVLKGDMSLVGTRPPLISEFTAYQPHHRARMSIKPGITGLWQVSGRSEIKDFEEVVRLDTQYIKNWSLLKDIQILIQTVFVVLKRKGSM